MFVFYTPLMTDVTGAYLPVYQTHIYNLIQRPVDANTEIVILQLSSMQILQTGSAQLYSCLPTRNGRSKGFELFLKIYIMYVVHT